MIDPASLPYEVGKYKPPKEHRFKPGNVPRGHRRRGSLGLLALIRRKLEEEIPGKGKTVADALVAKIAAEALRNPIKYWPILKALVDREGAPVLVVASVQAGGMSDEAAVKADRLEGFLRGLPVDQREAALELLFEMESAVGGVSRMLGDTSAEAPPRAPSGVDGASGDDGPDAVEEARRGPGNGLGGDLSD